MKPSGSYVDGFTVHSSTGALVDADATPTAAAYKNGTVDSGITVTVTKISTGNYKATCTVGSGYVSGDLLSVFATCAVSSVTVGVWLKTVEIESSFVSDVYARLGAPAGASVSEDIAAVPTAAENVVAIEAAVIPVDVTHVNGVPASVQTDLAKAGDAMTLTTGERSSIATAVWAATERTLSSFGTLAADVWASATRTLTAATNLSIPSAADIATSVWAAGTRTLSSFGTLTTDAAAAVWAYATRVLTAATNLSIPSAATVAAAVLDEPLAGHIGTGTLAEYVTNTQSTSSSANTKLDSVATAANLALVKADTAAIKLKTDTIAAAPSAADNAAAVWAATERTLTAGTGGATAEDVWTYADRTLTSAGTLGNYTIDAVVDGDGNPLAGVTVTVTTDRAGTDVEDQKTTNAFGLCSFTLDLGTYYLWYRLSGKISVDAQQVEVTA